MTGDELFFFFFFSVAVFFDDSFARAGRGDHELRVRSAGHLLEGASPSDFVDFFFFLVPSGVSLPLGGWVPLAVFSQWFPRVSRVGGGEFFSCYLLHLASFSLRCR